MMTNLQKEIQFVFKKFPEYWEGETLLKNKAIEDIRNYEPNLLAALLENDAVKETYSVEINDNYIFKNEEFISMLRYKNYLENSYTKYSNQIGLTSDDKYLNYSSDIVLDFPHKDGVLEGGMTQEDSGKQEIIYHNILAKEEIDVLYSPKVLTNIKKYDVNGVKNTLKITKKDNLILKGNNLIALHTLRNRFENKVKSIFIDPPYFFVGNKANDAFSYNSNFKLSTWLTFMKNRIEIAYELLNDNGVLFITISDEGAHYLKVMCDDIFGMDNFIADVTWESRSSVSSDGLMSMNSNHVLIYTKSKNHINKNNFRLALDMETFKYDDNDGRGPYRIEPFDAPNIRKNLEYPIVNPNTNETYFPPEGRCWRTTQSRFNKLLKENRIRFGVSGKAKPQLKSYYRDVKDAGKGKASSTIWHNVSNSISWFETNTNTSATKHQEKMFSKNIFTNPKPEELVQRAIELSSDEGDIVLDFFMGSATTQAVAMKMNRQFIGVEQMDYINTVSVPRLQKVIEGEQGGISNDVSWEGGGSFVYAELYELNQIYIDKIQAAADQDSIQDVLKSIQSSDFLNLKVDLNKVFNKNDEFFELSLDEQKAILIQVLDNNQLYLSYSEIDDSQYAIDEDTKAFNASFYNEEV